jgi:hexosaminidase
VNASIHRSLRVFGSALSGLAFAAAFTANARAGGIDPDLAALHLLPRPQSVRVVGACSGASPESVLAALSASGEPGGIALVRERWSALGIVARRGNASVAERRLAASARTPIGAYDLAIDARGATLSSATREGIFDAYATLAQLPIRDGARFHLPCVAIADAPALRWRILSDDVSRGPLPTMRYFQERIRTIASFKYNGYSPYMEHVFVDPAHPLPAPLDGLTPTELRRLATYARRFHVAFIPEQQTFAHMHETLKYERYADLAELPHGYLLSPADPRSQTYARDLIASELAVVPHPPFFHIGSDEPSDLGRGRSKTQVAELGDGPVYARHVIDTANFVIARGGGRPMIWDDALAKHPELFGTVPKSLVFINWHYGSDATYQPYIDRIARGGFDQMVAPGALNWNEIYPDLDAAFRNIDRFVTEGKRSHVLGLFQTVWHDDGETLFEATWVPVVYAGASAWEARSIDRARFTTDFAHVFFGSDDLRYASDIDALARARTTLRGHNPREYGDYLFWADPFEADLAKPATLTPAGLATPASESAVNGTDAGNADLAAMSQIRIAAEEAMAHLRLAPPPPLHRNAAAVIALAARRYDLLGRDAQIAREARAYYDDARANADGKHDGYVYRGLFIAKYLFWEQRDAMLALEPLVRRAWEYENRTSHEASVLERYHLAAQRAIARADRINDTVYRDYAATKTLPTFDDAIALPR